MLQFWPSSYSTFDLYGFSAGAANLYQSFVFPNHSWRKIELINLINDPGSEPEPPYATYYTCSFPIITTESKRIGLARKFSFDY